MNDSLCPRGSDAPDEEQVGSFAGLWTAAVQDHESSVCETRPGPRAWLRHRTKRLSGASLGPSFYMGWALGTSHVMWVSQALVGLSDT